MRFPHAEESDDHEGLCLLLTQDSIPAAIMMDNATEQTMGNFRKKAREMGCHIKKIEPYSPWQNAAEDAVREVQ